ncbi:MAG: hypothetical protein U1A77_17260 [Pirellulales bacterium]
MVRLHQAVGSWLVVVGVVAARFDSPYGIGRGIGRIHLLLVEALGGRVCAVWDVWVGCVLGAVVIPARWLFLG